MRTTSLALAGALALAAAVAAGVASCGHDHADPCGGHSHDPMCLVCQGDEDPVTAGSTKAGQQGNLSIEIVGVDPLPLTPANHTFTVRVRDGAGAALEGVTFAEVEPFYPPGGHGTPIVPQVTEAAPGEYTITRVNFVHPGRWELRFELTAGQVSDRVVMTLCVEEGEGA